MVQILNDEGFSIKSRELHRVRTTHRWLLRSPTGAGVNDKTRQPNDNAGAIVGQSAGDILGVHNGSLDHDLLMSAGVGSVNRYMSHPAEDRRREMEAESDERWVTKKRRRRTRQYAGMPADPPGPPRFPSETTLAQSQEILGLDKAAYADVRQQFQTICETEGIFKKSVAGPKRWEDVKNALINRIDPLRTVFWIDKSNLEQKQLALDVVCSDVTKRMRESLDKPLLMADVKNILDLDPEKTREVRLAFYKILEADGFTSKVALGPERWHELKQKWVDECDTLRKTFTRLEEPQTGMLKHKALEALATDVMKRLRDDLGRRKDTRADNGGPMETSLESLRYDDPAGGMPQLQGDASSFAAMLVPDQSHHVHPPRILPEHLLDAQMGMQMPMDTGLSQSLLLDPNAQGGFMDSHQQFMTGPGALSAGTSPFDAPHATAFQPAAPNHTVIPIYLREVNNVGPVGDLWIGFLSMPSPSLEELRQVAAQKIPGSTCTGVEGLVKVPGMGGQSVGLPIQNDAQLAAHLSEEGPPTFHVRLTMTNMYAG